MNKIYMHKNKENGKVYIGQTKRKLSHRWGPNGKEYLQVRNGEYVQPKFAAAIEKYGWDSFDHELLLETELDSEAKLMEAEFIKRYNSISDGYNIESGGKSNKKLSAETKAKLSASKIGDKNPMFGKEAWNRGLPVSQHVLDVLRNPTPETRLKKSISKIGKNNPMFGRQSPNLGIPLSEETKRKLSDALKGNPSPMKGKKLSEEQRKAISERVSGENHPNFGKHLSEDHRRKISESNKGKQSGENHPNYGIKFSKEIRAKISSALKGRKAKPELVALHFKKVRNTDTGQIFASIREANISCGLKPDASNIQAQIRGKTKSAGGYHWEYA